MIKKIIKNIKEYIINKVYFDSFIPIEKGSKIDIYFKDPDYQGHDKKEMTYVGMCQTLDLHYRYNKIPYYIGDGKSYNYDETKPDISGEIHLSILRPDVLPLMFAKGKVSRNANILPLQIFLKYQNKEWHVQNVWLSDDPKFMMEFKHFTAINKMPFVAEKVINLKEQK
jgi:hypothetical protein